MRIINNRTRENHKTFLIDCFKESDYIIIVSPFVANDFNFFPFNECEKVRKITLLTTLKPNDFEQVNKVIFFRKLLDFGKVNGVDVEILIDNSLHGKLYICQKDDIFFKAIITSANFTSSGLRVNNEWGISIGDSHEIEKIVIDLKRNIVVEPITDEILKGFEDKINTISKPSGTNYDLNLVADLKLKNNPLNIQSNINYWLKPIGVSNNIISRNHIFDEVDSNLHFSDKVPRGVKQGDILINYAVGHKNILSIYRVTSRVLHTGNESDRWPYYVVGENLTPFYGKEWSKYNITISNQRQDALNSGIIKLTPSGKNSYGSLMRGADKLKITKNYADFLIDKIVKINDKIASEYSYIE